MKWSLKYDRCTKCGTSQTGHVARGLCKNCYDSDIERRHKDVNRIRKYGESRSLLTEDYIIENYVVKEKSLGDIAREANCSRQYVYKIIVSYGIPLRSKNAARSLALSQEKIKINLTDEYGDNYSVTLKTVGVNEEFFSSWSAEMAYVLGVVYTDGNLNPGRIREPWRSKSTNTVPAFTISQKERELLDKILFMMECDAKLIFHKERKYGDIVSGALYEFRISNEKVYDDLVKLGLSPKKSLTLSFPQIPKKYIRHFIRGCWDGDGSVYIDKQSKSINASFVSGSLKFIEGLITALKDAGFPERMIYIHKRKNPCYYIRVTGAQVVKLYHYLYDDVPQKQYLERKFNLFRISLEMNTKQPALSSGKPYH